MKSDTHTHRFSPTRAIRRAPGKAGANGRPEGPVKRKATYSFRPAWQWPSDVEEWFRRQLGTARRPVYHICSGSSTLGDVRVDLSHPAATIQADVLRGLPFRDASVHTIVTDPPYPWDAQRRMRFGSELARIAAPDCLLLWNAPWVPAEGHWWFEDVLWATRRIGMPCDARLLLRARRRPRTRLAGGLE